MKTHEKIERPTGSEGTCPKCGNGNAMLFNPKISRLGEAIYNCRDCGHSTKNPIFIDTSAGYSKR